MLQTPVGECHDGTKAYSVFFYYNYGYYDFIVHSSYFKLKPVWFESHMRNLNLNSS